MNNKTILKELLEDVFNENSGEKLIKYHSKDNGEFFRINIIYGVHIISMVELTIFKKSFFGDKPKIHSVNGKINMCTLDLITEKLNDITFI